MKDYKKEDLPHSKGEHNPFWCGGDGGGEYDADTPCWSCINYLHQEALLVEVLDGFIVDLLKLLASNGVSPEDRTRYISAPVIERIKRRRRAASVQS